MNSSKRLAVVILSIALVTQMNTNISVIMADIARDFPSASAAQIQYVLMFAMLGSFSASLSSGYFSRRFGIKTMLVFGLTAIFAGGIMQIVFHRSIAAMYAFSFIAGFGQGFLAPLAGTMLACSYSEKKRAFLFGLNSTFTTGAAALLAMLSGIIGVRGWVGTYYLYLLTLPVAVVTIALTPKDKTTTPHTSETKSRVPPIGWLYCAVLLLMFIAYAAFPLNISAYVAALEVGNAVSAGVCISVITVVSAVIGLMFGRLIKIARLYIGALTALFGLLGTVIAYSAQTLGAIYIAAAMLGVFFGTAMTGSSYVLSRVCTPDEIGPSFSVASAFLTLGFILSPFVVNNIAELLGSGELRGIFFTSSLLLTVALLLQLVLSTRLRHLLKDKRCKQ